VRCKLAFFALRAARSPSRALSPGVILKNGSAPKISGSARPTPINARIESLRHVLLRANLGRVPQIRTRVRGAGEFSMPHDAIYRRPPKRAAAVQARLIQSRRVRLSDDDKCWAALECPPVGASDDSPCRDCLSESMLKPWRRRVSISATQPHTTAAARYLAPNAAFRAHYRFHHGRGVRRSADTPLPAGGECTV
jgi:hypothetical protein